jgi:hypothetical protein
MLAALLAVTLAPCVAGAHALGLSSGTWVLDGNDVVADLVFPVRDTGRLLDALGPAARGLPALQALDRALVPQILVFRGEAACRGATEAGDVTEGDAFRIRVRFACPAGHAPVSIGFNLLASLGAGAQHIARIRVGDHAREQVLAEGRTSFELRPDKPTGWGFLGMGVGHILGGWDHLVFLLGLLLIGGTWKSVLATVTSFTLAHSITLAVAALGVFAPAARFVEPAIGLTIAFVGVENILRPEPTGRWRITFALGLVHGFAFASALGGLGLTTAEVVPALVLFNVGVELGQIAVLAVVLPLILLARRREWVVRRAVPAVSVVVGLIGLALFAGRLVEGFS